LGIVSQRKLDKHERLGRLLHVVTQLCERGVAPPRMQKMAPDQISPDGLRCIGQIQFDGQRQSVL
jgi:hypothetical protein